MMRNASIAVLREIGVETGGSNVQFAVNPADGRLVVIEMNPRVSRSSALASKATGFPIAKIAAKLAVGYTLDELENDITGGATPASFEPSIDYVVTKIPRFAFEKFPGASPVLTTAMKSVGEVMAIGRTFQESLQKALRGLETGLTGLDEIEIPGADGPARQERHPRRARHADARPAAHGRAGDPHGHLAGRRARHVQDRPVVPRADRRHHRHGSPRARARPAAGRAEPAHAEVHGLLRRPPRVFDEHRRRSDSKDSRKSSTSTRSTSASTPAPPSSPRPPPTCTRPTRRPSPASLADEAQVSDRKKVVILGGGPNRIGQGIEFDYCCVPRRLCAGRGRL